MFFNCFKIPKHVFFIALIGTFLCVFTNELNYNYRAIYLPNQFGMVQTADETSYIVPPENFINLGEWKDNSNGLTSYFIRPPGYGMFYLACYSILGSNALLGMKTIQITFFFFSILLFFRLSKLIGLSNKMLLITLLLFAFLPCYSGFVYYSMTEGVTPFFVIWSVLSLLEASESKKPSWQLFASNSFLLLIRPQLAIIPVSIFFYFFVKKMHKPLLYLSFSFLPLFAWYVRTGVISNEVPSLHPIYSKTNNHFYRPSHEAITDLFRIWEWRSDIFHNQTGRIGFGDSTIILGVVSELPKNYQEGVIPLLFQFRDLNVYREKELKDQKITNYLPNELAFIENVEQMKEKFISQNLTDYYLKTPLLSLKEFLNKSYLNLFIFQITFRGNALIEVLRIVCWLVLLSSFIFTFLLLFKKKISSIHFYLIVSLAVFMFYLVFVQRLNEERYIIPILPLFLVFGALFLDRIKMKSTNLINH